MKTLKEYIIESYNDNSSLAEYLIVHCDYKYIVEPILNSNFSHVIESDDPYDFECSNATYPKIGIYYKAIYREKKEINIDSKLLNNGHIATNKKEYKSFLAYIYEGNLCLIDAKEFNNKLDLSKAKPELQFELSDNMKSIYNDIYNLYDNLSPQIKSSKDFKKFDEFKKFEEILK